MVDGDVAGLVLVEMSITGLCGLLDTVLVAALCFTALLFECN